MHNDTDPIILLGGGGHASVVAEAASLARLQVIGFLDDDPHQRLCDTPGAVHLGALDQVAAVSGPWICALGSLSLRRAIIDRMGRGTQPAMGVVHPSAAVSESARVGVGVFAGPLSVIHTGARIDAHAIINSAAVVEHHCHIGANAHIAPNATLGGNTMIGPETLIGLGAVVLPGVRVGAGCVVGAGAVVCEHVPDGGRVAGNPARSIDSVLTT